MTISSVDDIFKGTVQDPFHYDLNINNLKPDSKPEDLFENIKNIFFRGLNIISNSEDPNSLKLDNIKKEDFDLVRKHMLSIGIETKYKVFDLESIDYKIRGLLYDLEKIDNLKIEVNMDWKTQLINQFKYTFNNAPVSDLIKFNQYTSKHKEVSWLLNLKVEIKELKDIAIKFVRKEEPNNIHLIYFDFAKLMDYPYNNKFTTPETKHVR